VCNLGFDEQISWPTAERPGLRLRWWLQRIARIDGKKTVYTVMLRPEAVAGSSLIIGFIGLEIGTANSRRSSAARSSSLTDPATTPNLVRYA
jgi:hypothetical protein